MKCKLCEFNNPKGTATAVILNEGKILLLKRSEEPFKGQWDLPGGFMNAGETPGEAIRREVKEELNVECDFTFIDWFPGVAYWHGEDFAVLSHAYLVNPHSPISLNKEENEDHAWVLIKDVHSIAFDSNQKIIDFLKGKFIFDMEQIKKLISQLDSSATVSEQSFYKAILNGYVSVIREGEKLIGMGWIFARQTALRKQAVVEDMIVDEAYRGRRLGEKILLDLIRWAKDNGVDTIELTSSPKRIAANELYKKTGFKLHSTNHYLYKV